MPKLGVFGSLPGARQSQHESLESLETERCITPWGDRQMSGLDVGKVGEQKDEGTSCV